MKKAKQLLFLVYCFAFFSGILLAQDIFNDEKINEKKRTESSPIKLQDILSAEIIDKLFSDGKIQELAFKDDDIALRYAPKTQYGSIVTNDWDFASFGEPIFSSESLYYMEKKGDISHEESVKKISEIMRSISRMEGMEYYSNTRRKMYTLYKKAYTVDNSLDRQKITDQIFGNANGKILFGFQHDASFGDCLYEISYRQSNDEVSFKSVNMDPLYYSIFKCVKKQNVTISLVLTDVEDGVLIYALVQAKYIDFPGFEKAIKKSFDARIEAIFNWFVKLYEE